MLDPVAIGGQLSSQCSSYLLAATHPLSISSGGAAWHPYIHANRVRGLQASLTLRVSMEGSHGASQFGCDRRRSDHYGTY